MKKLVGLVGTAAMISFSAISAPTSGNLNFTFQGTIPAIAVTPGSWKFVDMAGANYTPSVLSFSTTRNADGSYTLTMASPEVFVIKSASAGKDFTTGSKIQASLASTAISGTALTSTSGGSVSATPKVSINGTILTDKNQDVVATVTGDQATLSMTAQIDLPKTSVKDTGGNVSMTSAVIFSADVSS